jgi:hypothetical protein
MGHRKDGMKHGFGKIKWQDGSILLANFENNKAQGVCLFRNNDGSSFNGRLLLIKDIISIIDPKGMEYINIRIIANLKVHGMIYISMT